MCNLKVPGVQKQIRHLLSRRVKKFALSLGRERLWRLEKMIPRYCRDCKFMTREMVPSGRGYQPVYVCTNVHCSDPVDANPIPCGIARREATLCGMQGKYYQKTEPLDRKST